MTNAHTNVLSIPLSVIGWDIGGVNLKAARRTATGWQVVEQPFYIWQRRDELAAAVRDIAARLGPARHAAITITAELSDAFRTKREGINFVLDAMQSALPESDLHVFGVDGYFYPPAAARAQPLRVAAANWLATAQLVAQHHPEGLLVDIGSTSTDIIPLKNGQPAAQGRTDPERLLRGELLYTGAQRTPVFAVVRRLPLWGGWCPVAAELFATTQDVYLLLGQLAPAACTSPTADGRPATVDFAAERLARVVCADIEMLTTADLETMARTVAAAQVQQIAGAMAQVLSAQSVGGPVLVVGSGAFLAEQAAAQLGREALRPAALLGNGVDHVAPAAAVALLLAELAGDGPSI